MEAYFIAPDLGSSAHYYHHRYCYCSDWSWLLIIFIVIVIPTAWYWFLSAHYCKMLCSTSGVPFPSPHCPMSSVNAEFNPTFGIFQQSEIVDSLCSSATFWQTSDQVKVTQAQGRGMPSLDPWPGKSKNGQKNLLCTIVVCKSKHFSGSPQR